MRRTLLLPTLLLLGVGGCAELSQRASPPSTALTSGANTTIDRPTLQTMLLDLAEYATAEVSNAVRDVLANAPDAAARVEAQAVRTQVATSTTAIVTSGEPEAALLDFITFLTLERWVVERWLAGRPAGAPEHELLVALDRALSRTHEVTDECITDAQRARLDELIATWKEEHPHASYVGIVRIADFSSLRSEPFRPTVDQLEPSLMAPVSDAQREIERSRILGERFAFILQRLPFLARWQAEETLYRLLAQPEVTRFESALTEGRGAIDRLSAAIDEARTTAKEIETAISSFEPTDLAPANQLASEVRLAISETKAILPEARETIVELKDAIAGAERVTTALKELTQGPDGKPIDLTALSTASDRFVTAAADLRTAIQQANALLSSDDATQRLAELTDTGKKGIDHLIWRIALLMVIGAALTMVLMVVRSLTRPRAEPPERPRRA